MWHVWGPASVHAALKFYQHNLDSKCHQTLSLSLSSNIVSVIKHCRCFALCKVTTQWNIEFTTYKWYPWFRRGPLGWGVASPPPTVQSREMGKVAKYVRSLKRNGAWPLSEGSPSNVPVCFRTDLATKHPIPPGRPPHLSRGLRIHGLLMSLNQTKLHTPQPRIPRHMY